MARIKLGVIVAAIAGKVSGNVFATGKGGAYVRKWSKPTNPRTSAQNRVRSAMTALASSWRGLTDANRKTWEASALNRPYTDGFGEQKHLSGFGLFMKQNQFAQPLGLNTLINAPAATAIPNYRINSASRNLATTGDLVLEVERLDGPDILDEDFDNILVGQTNPFGAGQKGPNSKFVLVVDNGTAGVVLAGKVATITIPAATVDATVARPVFGQKTETTIKPLNTNDPWDTVNDKFATETTHT